jgi:sterol 3beta-glucosyltransferase
MPYHAASGEEREATVEQPHITVQDDSPSHLSAQGRTVTADATIGSDGRLSISFLLKHAATAPPDLPEDGLEDGELAGDDLISNWKDVKVPKLQIVMHIVGSRGDVQPFLSLGQALQKEGHRVRVGTHGTFKSFVEGADLEHFDIGGDPEALMSYMVKVRRSYLIARR